MQPRQPDLLPLGLGAHGGVWAGDAAEASGAAAGAVDEGVVGGSEDL